MIYLFILFFNTNFALSNEFIENYTYEDNNSEKIQPKNGKNGIRKKYNNQKQMN